MTASTTLVLGGSGKSGRHVAAGLRAAGTSARTASRSGSDVHFDWDDRSTWDAALAGARAMYLVGPTERLDHTPLVVELLDRAQAEGVRHVTYLSARGVEHAPPSVTHRAIELDLLRRPEVTTTLLRPSWFMQNFTDWLFNHGADEGVVAAPTGDGAEAFIDARDIADVAVATLLDPAAHAGAAYALTGPEALTFAEVAAALSAVAGRPVAHLDLSRDAWIAWSREVAGLPVDYATQLAFLLDEVVRNNGGAEPSDAVERVTGRPPRRFADWVRRPEVAAAWSRVTA